MSDWLKGKGAQYNPANRFSGTYFSKDEIEGIDEDDLTDAPRTQVFFEHPKKAVTKNSSPDLRMMYSINPYQGCEHGCIYCYARNSHEYWGFGAGLDFESKIIVKPDIVNTLVRQLSNPRWHVSPIMLSGNTDCYQPLERKHQLTRNILKVMLDFRHPVSLITKNALVTRDTGILEELASLNLTSVYFSISTANEALRRKLEPRTASFYSKLKAMEKLSSVGVPVGIMTAPIIPGLNDHEIPTLLESAANAGARTAAYTVVRLNGVIGEMFEDWLKKTYPERRDKVLNQIRSMHDGKVNDTEWGRRLTGEGTMSETIRSLFEMSKKKYFADVKPPQPLDCSLFRRQGNLRLF